MATVGPGFPPEARLPSTRRWPASRGHVDAFAVLAVLHAGRLTRFVEDDGRLDWFGGDLRREGGQVRLYRRRIDEGTVAAIALVPKTIELRTVSAAME